MATKADKLVPVPDSKPVFIPNFEPEPDKLPTLKQWMRTNSHETHKFTNIVYPIQVIWAIGTFGAATINTTEFRISYKCDQNEFERLVSFVIGLCESGFRPTCKVDRDNHPTWTIAASNKAEKDLRIEAIERDDLIIGYAIRSPRQDF